MGNADYLSLVTRWRAESNTPLLESATADAVRATFSALGVPATPDVCEFYSIVGGMEECCPDDRMFEFWSLERIATENSESPWEFVWFADWLISSHLYALRPVSDSQSAVYIDHKCDRNTPPEFLADILYEFVSCLVNDPESVYVWHIE